MKQQQKAYALAISAVLLWSTVATAFKLALKELNFIELLVVASWTSLAVFFFALFIGKQLPLIAAQRRMDYLRSAFLGLLNPCLYYLILFKAYSLLPAQIAQPLNYTWPIVLVLLSIIFLGQQISLRRVLALSVSFCGVAMISMKGGLATMGWSDAFGVLLALGSSVIWALYWIFNMKDPRNPNLRLFTNFVFGTLYVSVIYLASTPLRVPSLSGILSGIYVGIFEMGLTFMLWLAALHASSSTARISNLVFLSPFVSLIMIHFVLGEKIFISTIAGLVLIVSGIGIQQASRDRGEASSMKNKEKFAA